MTKRTVTAIFSAAMLLCGACPEAAVSAETAADTGLICELNDHDLYGKAVCITGLREDAPRDLVIPAEIGGYPVISVESGAFRNAALDSVVIAEGIEEVLPNAFAGSTVRSVTFPASVHTIAVGVCGGCKSLTELHIAEGITEIEGRAFQDCDALAELHLPESISVIGNGTFADCDALKNVTLPAGVSEVQAQAFSRCGALRSVQFLNPACGISNVAGTVSNGTDSAYNIYYHGWIVGAAGSSAESYAEKAGWKFAETGTQIRGDVSGDFAIGADDAQLALTAFTDQLAGNPVSLSEAAMQAADADLDGKLSAADAQDILVYYTENILSGMETDWSAGSVGSRFPTA